MRTEQIIYLNMIRRCSSLHKASDALHISTQALSLSIRTLEKELGFTILERSRTGVTFTEEGQELLDIGIDFLQQLKQIQEKHKRKYESILTGTLEIMVTNGVIETLFPALISQLYSDYPEFRLKTIVREFNDILDTWSDEKAEIGFVYCLSKNQISITPFDDTQFSFRPLLSGKYYCTVSNNYSIANYKSISLSTMAKHPIVLFTPTSNILLKLFTNVAQPEIIFADSFAIYKQLLIDGAGLGMTLLHSESKIPLVASPNFKFIPFKEHIESELGFLFKKNTILSHKAQAFIDYLTDYISKIPPTTLSIS